MQCWTDIVLMLVLSVFQASAFKVSSTDYCYKEPSCSPYTWGKTFPSCLPNETSLHSPIDLSDKAVKSISEPQLTFKGFDKPQTRWTVANVRDTVVVEFEAGMTVSGGGLQHEYRVVEMRFHWGTSENHGSEHTLNKHRFPMEMQIVGLAPEFKDVDSASLQKSGLVMIAVFIDMDAKENSTFKIISDAVLNVQYPGMSVNVTPPALMSLLPDGLVKYYRYQGGQTTPPCRQTVEWIVFAKPISITREEYLCFATKLYYSQDKNAKLLVENYRPIQDSSKHQIYVSSDIDIRSPKGAGQSQHVFFTPLLLLLSLLHFNLRMA